MWWLVPGTPRLCNRSKPTGVLARRSGQRTRASETGYCTRVRSHPPRISETPRTWSAGLASWPLHQNGSGTLYPKDLETSEDDSFGQTWQRLISLQVIGPYHCWVFATSCLNIPSCRESPQLWKISSASTSPHDIHWERVWEDAEKWCCLPWLNGCLWHHLARWFAQWSFCYGIASSGSAWGTMSAWRRQVNGLPRGSAVAPIACIPTTSPPHSVAGLSMQTTFIVTSKWKLSLR